MPSILIVEDELEIAELIRFILEKEGFTNVTIAQSYRDAMNLLTETFDTYILDINLGDGSGLDVGSAIRERSDAPILYVSANVEDKDRISGFKHGGDDYITKPFNPIELAARVKVNVERYLKHRTAASKLYDFNEKTGELRVGSKSYVLSGKQYLLMEYLYENQDRILTKENIYETIWENKFIDENTVMVHIRKLREKLEKDPSHPELLVTLRGTGYMLKSGKQR